MEKFTTILSAAMLSLALVSEAAAGCLQDAASLAMRAQGDQDWLRRETIMALVMEAKRDALRGRETACSFMLEQARVQARVLPR